MYYPFPYYEMSPYYGYPYQDPSFQQQFYERQPMRGIATWTNGGNVTKCGMPWSTNNFMTVAVSPNSPYSCGEKLRIRNLSTPSQRTITVTVVDEIASYGPHQISLHRRAFEALGAHPSIGILHVEIEPNNSVEYEKWGKLLLSVVKASYPSADVTDYEFVDATDLQDGRRQELFDFIVEQDNTRKRVRAMIIFHPATDQISTIHLQETNV